MLRQAAAAIVALVVLWAGPAHAADEPLTRGSYTLSARGLDAQAGNVSKTRRLFLR